MSRHREREAQLRHVGSFGQISAGDEGYRGPVPEDFTFNSPIGLCMDRNRNVWICDTGNNRIVIVDGTFSNIVCILRAPGPGIKPFLMPFHVCEHPDRDRMYITDIGNSRVVVVDYGQDHFDYAFSFGFEGDGINADGFEPLQDPNGITMVREAGGALAVYVCDEFFHARSGLEPAIAAKTRTARVGPPQANRCVKFDEHGRFQGDFRAVATDVGKPGETLRPLYWPQGIGSDAQGMLYVANTGSYEILKTVGLTDQGNAAASPGAARVVTGEVFAHSFGEPNGIGMLNIMRSVNVIGPRVFVADHVLNTISVYDLHGRPLTTIVGMNPLWNHGHESRHTLSDLAYYAMEDEALLSPYVICQGEADDIFLISEPFTSRILKVRIPDLAQESTAAFMLTALGNRRNVPAANRRASPQFNCVTSAMTVRRPVHMRAPAAPAGDGLPAWLGDNPYQQWYMGLSRGMTAQYRFWYERAFKHMMPAPHDGPTRHGLVFNVDAGNWVIKAWSQEQQVFRSAPRVMEGYYIPGDLAMTMYYPRDPLLGQVCPGSPLTFVTNFNLGTVSIYQFGPRGKLINYGLPFGFKGTREGCLSGPQGVAVSDEGAIYIADSLNNRIAMWRILQTGQVVFIRNFGWDPVHDRKDRSGDIDSGAFMPTDVAIDADGRLFVADQMGNRICVFDHHGTSLWSYGKEGYWDDEGSDEAHFMLPTSVSIDDDHLIVNDLVNRALKVFRVHPDRLEFVTGKQFFKDPPEQGGIWMPYLLHAHERRIYVPDSTYNVVQIFEY